MLPDEIPVNFTIRPKHWLLSPFGVLAAIGMFYLPWESPAAPAWVQAIGSIGAILVAAWAALHSSTVHQRALDKADQERIRIVWNALYEFAHNSHAALKIIIERVQQGDKALIPKVAKYIADRMESDLVAAQAIKLTELPSTEAIRKLLAIKLTLENSIGMVRVGEIPGGAAEYELLARELQGRLKDFDDIRKGIPRFKEK
jgi:hypothetical protein